MPLLAFEPLQAPEAVHAVASVDLQLSVVLPPATTLDDVAARETVGISGDIAALDAGGTPLVHATSAIAVRRIALSALMNITRCRSDKLSGNYKRLRADELVGRSLLCR